MIGLEKRKAWMSRQINLREIREGKGITLEQISQDTKISKRVLEAFEAGDVSGLFLGEIYLKGFAKTYARYIGVDEDEVIKMLFGDNREQVDTNKPSSRKEASEHSMSRLDMVHLFEIILSAIRRLVIFVFVSIAGIVLKIPRKVLFGAIVVVLAIFIVLLANHRTANERLAEQQPIDSKRVQVDAPNPLSEENRETKTVKKNVEKNKVEEEEKKAIIVEPEKKKDTFTIIVEAMDDCWLRVKADGVELFRRTLNKGDIEKWEAKKELSLWVGNAGVLKVTCGDKVYNGLGRKGRVIKDIVFTPDCSYKIRKR